MHLLLGFTTANKNNVVLCCCKRQQQQQYFHYFYMAATYGWDLLQIKFLIKFPPTIKEREHKAEYSHLRGTRREYDGLLSECITGLFIFFLLLL